MKSTFLALVAGSFLLCLGPLASGDQPQASNSSPAQAVEGAATTTAPSLAFWEYSVVSPADGNTYTARIVGRSPLFHGHTSTTIQTYLVPVVVTFSDGTVFDPTIADACSTNSAVNLVQQSPIFQTTDFQFTDINGKNPIDMGNTQYIDAFQRGSFWQYVSPQANIVLPYHTLLGLTTLPALSIKVPKADGAAQSPVLVGQCGFGSVDATWLNNYVVKNLLPAVEAEGVDPTSLPIFLVRDVVTYPTGGSDNCPPACSLGEHGHANGASGGVQTYVVADFDTTGAFAPDVAGLSGQIAGWLDDPYGANTTPGWNAGFPPYQPGILSCESHLEVGIPLSGTQFPVLMSNSFTYNPEELVFPSWFYRQVPSIAEGGRYSDQGTFTSDAGPVCLASAGVSAGVQLLAAAQ